MVKYDKLEPGLFYHVYNRGNNRENLFIEEKNYSYFLHLWQKYVGKVAETYSYSLLKNHFHFFIRIKSRKEIESLPINNKKYDTDKRITLAFSNFFNAYAKAINKSYKRTGSLFQERFRRKLIDSDSYFTEIMFYIHGNAQKHGFTNNFFTYPYSSFQTILSEEPTFIKRAEVLSWFGGKEKFIQYHIRYRDSLISKNLFLENPSDE